MDQDAPTGSATVLLRPSLSSDDMRGAQITAGIYLENSEV